MPSSERKNWIDPNDRELSLSVQLELAGLSKASYYYQPVPETARNLELMTLIDEIYTDCPFYGSRRIRAELKERDHEVNRKRVIRLMQKMGFQAIFPKRNLSKAAENYVKYPYLLRDLMIDRPNQVCGTDITYMNGKGRAFDNIFVERLWRSVKYEEVYLRRYETGKEAVDGLNRYLTFYNDRRLHQALGYTTPRSWYTGEQRIVQ